MLTVSIIYIVNTIYPSLFQSLSLIGAIGLPIQFEYCFLTTGDGNYPDKNSIKKRFFYHISDNYNINKP